MPWPFSKKQFACRRGHVHHRTSTEARLCNERFARQQEDVVVPPGIYTPDDLTATIGSLSEPAPYGDDPAPSFGGFSGGESGGAGGGGSWDDNGGAQTTSYDSGDSGSSDSGSSDSGGDSGGGSDGGSSGGD